MTKEEFTFLSADCEQDIHVIKWIPDGEVKALFQIAHGISEYIDRYDSFASFLANQGFLVYGNDHLGHGFSRPEGRKTVYFGDGNTWETVVDDMYILHNIMKQEYPSVPNILMGHSMGSFLVRTYLITYPSTVEAAILMGTGQNPESLIAAGKVISKIFQPFVGKSGTSAFVSSCAFDSYNKPFKPNRTNFDWLSASTENVDKYLVDPMAGEPVSTELLYQMMRGLHFIAQKKNLAQMDLKTPVLFISGADDPVGQMSVGVKCAHQSFIDVGVKDATIKLYSGLRHEILNEDCKQEVYEDILNWINKKIEL